MNYNIERMLERDKLVEAAFTKTPRTVGEVAKMLKVSKSTIQTAIKRNPKIQFHGMRDEKYCTAYLYCVGTPSAIKPFEEYSPLTQLAVRWSTPYTPETDHAEDISQEPQDQSRLQQNPQRASQARREQPSA